MIFLKKNCIFALDIALMSLSRINEAASIQPSSTTNQRMQIAVNARFLLKGKLEGLGWYSHEVLRRMVEAHPEDTFHFLFDRPYHADFIYGKNVVPHVLFPPARHPLLWYVWFECAVPKALKKIQADVFFSPDSYASLNTKIRTVLTVHDLIPLHAPEQVPFLPRKYYQYFLPKFVARANQIVAISEHVKQDIIQTCRKAASTIDVVHNGIRTEFKPLLEQDNRTVRLKYSAGQPYIFYTGSINARKNIDRLIEAFDAFKGRTGHSAKLLIAGKKGWEMEAVEKAYASAKFKADVHFLGYVSNDEQVALMAAAEIFAYISLDEGFGLPLLEAMACGVPVLASDIPIFREIAGSAVFLVNPNEVDALSVELEKMMTSPKYALSKKESAAEKVLQYSWDRAAELTYNALLKKGY